MRTSRKGKAKKNGLRPHFPLAQKVNSVHILFVRRETKHGKPADKPERTDGMSFHLIRFRIWRIEVKLLEITVR